MNRLAVIVVSATLLLIALGLLMAGEESPASAGFLT